MTMTALTHIIIALILAAILVCLAASNLISDDQNREDNDQ